MIAEHSTVTLSFDVKASAVVYTHSPWSAGMVVKITCWNSKEELLAKQIVHKDTVYATSKNGNITLLYISN